MISGELHPKAKFLGNSTGTIMEGGCTVTYTTAAGRDSYYLTPPNIYARGLLFGSMFIELGDSATVSSIHCDLEAEIEFKCKVSLD